MSNAPPVFNNIGDFRIYEGQTVSFLAFALDPNNPGFIPQDRTANGTPDAARKPRPRP